MCVYTELVCPVTTGLDTNELLSVNPDIATDIRHNTTIAVPSLPSVNK